MPPVKRNWVDIVHLKECQNIPISRKNVLIKSLYKIIVKDNVYIYAIFDT